MRIGVLASLSPLLSLASGLAVSGRSQANHSSAVYPVSVSNDNSSRSFGFTNAFDVHYTVTLYVNGAPYQVFVDLGSSDTWFSPSAQGGLMPPDVIDTGINATFDYLAPGQVVLANVTLGPYTINNQAIAVVTNSTQTLPGAFVGVIGIGGAGISRISQALANSSYADNGTPVMYNLFKHQPELPNYMTFLMNQTAYTTLGDGGVVTIGNVLADKTDILNAPVIQSPTLWGQWASFMTGVSANGRMLTGHSGMNATNYKNYTVAVPEGSTVALFDTGTGLIVGPEYYAEQIYGNIPGAEKSELFGDVAWKVPCDTKLNISFVFGDASYPLRPADATFGQIDLNGTYTCYGTVLGAPIADATGADWLLGAYFMGSVYQLFDYGDPDPADGLYRTSTQLLTSFDPDEAWAEADALLAARKQAWLDAYSSVITMTATSTVGTLPATWTGAQFTPAVTTVTDSMISSAQSATPITIVPPTSVTSTGTATATSTAAAASSSSLASGMSFFRGLRAAVWSHLQSS
ncbi:aspartic peptidase domain-containing protein [Epithele typhae]|uniref:aspartic peptidase domain-containing protein n=1 Tax=Epithele typhae TaxID=378194 RepID=UPI002007D187|nr:aspartic peptidase domain-containing protein [Epithele typhae]KAH9934501.1 aspartic peptidase domain-containing protein [Epithele typhae]